MLPAPVDLLEADLWTVHLRLTEAQLSGTGIGAVDDEARALVAAYVAGDEAHAIALRGFLRRLRAELSHRESERGAAALAVEQAERDLARFRSHVHRAMREAGLERVKAGPGLLTFSTGPPAIRETNPNLVPGEFVRVIAPQRQLREVEIRRVLGRGGTIPGIALEPGDSVLVVR